MLYFPKREQICLPEQKVSESLCSGTCTIFYCTKRSYSTNGKGYNSESISYCFDVLFVFSPYYSDVLCSINSCDKKKCPDIGEQHNPS